LLPAMTLAHDDSTHSEYDPSSASSAIIDKNQPASANTRSTPNGFEKFTPTPDQHVVPDPESNFDFYSSAPPPLNYSINGVPGRQRAIVVWFTLFFIEAGILPLVLFFGIRWGTHLSITVNLAIITSLIGTVSSIKLTQRTWFLWYRKGHEHRRPIGASRWGVDCFQVLVGFALTAFFVPLIIGSSLQPAQPRVVAMSLPCVMITLGLPLLITALFPHRLHVPIRVSSLPPGRPLPPLAYMYVEDVVAVDGGGGQDFRHAWRTRYEESKVIRHVIRVVSLGWGLSAVVLAGALLAIVWTVPVDSAYGLAYGIPWGWVLAATLITQQFVRRALIRERREWVRAPDVHEERILPIQEGKYDRPPSLDDVRRRSSQHERVRPVSRVPPAAAPRVSSPPQSPTTTASLSHTRQ